MRTFVQAKGRIGLAGILFSLLCTPASAGDELGFAQRVGAQRAIEAVRYAHQLQANRSFAEAVPAELLERKVRTYLKQSLLLEQRWNTPLRAAALHAELRRIADSSLLPRRLEEIYAALGHDTRLIEETFARATLVDRLARSFFSADHEIHTAARAEAEQLRRDLDSGALDARAEHPRRMVREIRKKDLVAGGAGRAKPLSSRRKIEPIHEGRDSFVVSAILDEGDEATRVAVYAVPKETWESWWKGIEPDLDESLVQTVAAPDAAPPTPRSLDQSESLAASACHPSGQWINGSLDDVLTPRYNHTAVWTGQLMLVWGGTAYFQYPPGERYDPLTDTWSPISTVNEPTFHENHTAVWTGTEMIVWGGDTNTGGRYNPITDTWAPVPTNGAPSARQGHTAVWTGSRMVIWGGSHNAVVLGDGGLYNPATGWDPMEIAQAPSARAGHTATWTGSVMVVWGGSGRLVLNTGGRYNPASNTWSAITTQNAPTARDQHTAVWTGSRVIVWGGVNSSSTPWNTGGLYDPVSDNWDPTPTTGAPTARSLHTAVWTGTEMIVWGGFSDTGGRYDPAAGVWRTVTRVNGPASRLAHTAVWTGSLMMIWGGASDISGEYVLSTGGRYDPAVDIWTPIAFPAAQFSHTSIWTGNHMIVWGGWGDNGVPVNSGEWYDPLTDVWTPISLAGAPTPRTGHTAVWTGSEMIVWGGGGGSPLNSGGRYDPVTDVWAPTSLAGAPAARSSHTAVWSGSRMIIWGGSTTSTGGLYDPAMDTWSPTSMVNAPPPRSEPATVWTGREMIVWGGYTGGSGYLTSGGRYDPVADTWRPTSAPSTPPGPSSQGAVWTGSLMVVWGGNSGSGDTLTGSRYHPDTDTWRPMSPSGAPSYIGYDGVWTGTVLILWGAGAGATYHPYLDTWTPIPAAGGPQFWGGESAIWDGEGMILFGLTYTASSFGEDIGGRYVIAPDASQDTDADGFTVCAGDCDDADARVRPGGPQTCDGLNNDCGHPFWPSLTATNETFDGDGDARSACLDCNDADASDWGTPSATTDLTLTGPEPASLAWAPPATPGATAVRYDLLRSGGAADFGAAAVCVESNDGGDAFAVDPIIPAAGTVYYYLVRAENGCPGALGVGPLGADSQGQVRSGRTCP